jgi:hypothetical protein
MKKLMFVLLLIAGFTMNSEAQILNYYLYNNSATQDWNFAMDDAGLSPALYELNIAPGGTRSGALNTAFQPFSFPLEWKASSSSGCYVTNTEVGPINTTIGTTCPSINIDYKIVIIAPFLALLKMQFN